MEALLLPVLLALLDLCSLIMHALTQQLLIVHVEFIVEHALLAMVLHFALFVLKDQSSITEYVSHVKLVAASAVTATSHYVLLASSDIIAIQLEAAQCVQQIVQAALH